MRKLSLSILVTLTLGLSVPVWAQGGTGAAETQEDREARRLFLRGDRLYAEGDYERAAASFEEAYQLSPRPLLLFNLANAYERLGRIEEALGALRRYSPDAPEYEHETIARRILHLEGRLADQDSQAVNVVPASGGRDQGPSAKRVWSYVMFGVAGVALAAGVTLAVLSNQAGKDAEEQCIDGFCPEDAQDDLDREQSLGIAADVSLGVSLGTAVTGFVLLLTDKSSDGERTERRGLRFAASPSPTGGNVVLAGQF